MTITQVLPSTQCENAMYHTNTYYTKFATGLIIILVIISYWCSEVSANITENLPHNQTIGCL